VLPTPTAAPPAGRRPSRRVRPPAADPALRAYLNEQLAAVTGLLEQLRRAAATDALIAERTTLLRVRREVAADRSALRAAMRRLGASTDWAVVGASWISARAGRLLPLLHRLPVVDRVSGAVGAVAGALPAQPTREGVVEGLLVLEGVLGDLHRRAVAARLLGELVAVEPADRSSPVRGLAERARAQCEEVEAAHRRCAAPLLRG
jgi:hypothetical protein